MPPNPRIKIPIATTSTSRTWISAMMTGLLFRGFVRPANESKTLQRKTAIPICTPMTTLTSVWTMPNYWHINKSLSSRPSLEFSSVKMQLKHGTLVPIPSTTTTWTVFIFAIFASASSHWKSNCDATVKHALFITLPGMRSIGMRKVKWLFFK